MDIYLVVFYWWKVVLYFGKEKIDVELLNSVVEILDIEIEEDI